METWSTLKSPGRRFLTLDLIQHSNQLSPTPANDMAHQIITGCGNFTLYFKQLGFYAFPLFCQTLGPWFPNEMHNLLSSEKRTLGHWATVQFFFSLAQVRNFWCCLRSGVADIRNATVVAPFLLLMHWHLPQYTPCEVLQVLESTFLAIIAAVCSLPCCLSTFSHQYFSF